jgi:hypothetical protein
MTLTASAVAENRPARSSGSPATWGGVSQCRQGRHDDKEDPSRTSTFGMEQNGAPEHDASGHCPRGNLCDSAGCLLQSSPQICNSGDCFPAVHFAVITGQIIYILKRLVTKKNVTVVRAQASPHGDTLITKIRSGYGFHRILILR